MSAGQARWRVDTERLPAALLGGVLAVLVLLGVAWLIWPSSVEVLIALLDVGYVESSLRLAVPIAFAALGGIFAEKSGVINIGLEGLLIISAFTAVAVTHILASGGSASQTVVWVGFLSGVVASVLLTVVFAVITIRYRADQIIAGLAVWLVALGLAPFMSQILWGTVNSPGVQSVATWDLAAFFEAVPVLGPAVVGALDALPGAIAAVLGVVPTAVGAIPVVGDPILEVLGPGFALEPYVDYGFDAVYQIFFDAIPTVYMLLLAVPVSWYLLNRTTFGRWVRASGENPKALDTAGVNVTRVRYAAVLLSGVFSGIGGASLSLGLGQFIGSGQTMVSGRGFIGITAYLFGNYNPVGAFGATLLFSALDALQFRVQQVPTVDLPSSLVRIVPFVTVIVVLALVGRTRIPEAAGEHYESGEE